MITSAFNRYHGDGRTPDNSSRLTRGEKGCYLADPKLTIAVNTALAVEQPLLVTGEPGTGKTTLAWSIASELGLGDVLEFHTRSDHRARDVFYSFDTIRRFCHAHMGNSLAESAAEYVRYEALGVAIRSSLPRVVLIDEIDKAPRDFPNDLLDQIDQLAFTVDETGEHFKAANHHRPIIIITSNSERQLPDPFLRRCVFHHLAFPNAERLQKILHERLDHLNLSTHLTQIAVQRFEELRALDAFEKRPTTSELISWIRVLHRAGIAEHQLAGIALADLPYQGALVKTRADLELLDRQRTRSGG